MCILEACVCADGITQQQEGGHGDVVCEGGPQVGLRGNICPNVGRECGQWSLERERCHLPLEEGKKSPDHHRGKGVHTYTVKHGCGTPIIHQCTHMSDTLCGAAALPPESMLVVAGGERVRAHQGWLVRLPFEDRESTNLQLFSCHCAPHSLSSCHSLKEARTPTSQLILITQKGCK